MTPRSKAKGPQPNCGPRIQKGGNDKQRNSKCAKLTHEPDNGSYKNALPSFFPAPIFWQRFGLPALHALLQSGHQIDDRACARRFALRISRLDLPALGFFLDEASSATS
jgi:hypothetical protein